MILKLVSAMETKAPVPAGFSLSDQHGITVYFFFFHRLLKGVSAESRAGKRGGCGCVGGCSASKAIAILPMILSGLGELKTPTGLVMSSEPACHDRFDQWLRPHLFNHAVTSAHSQNWW